MDILTITFYFLIVLITYKVLDFVLRLPKISNLRSQYILVTGCDTGFGNVAAKRLDGMGCHVIAGCLTEAGETDLRKSCSEKLKTIQIDVSKKESIQRAYQLVNNILPHGKGLWGILNNAGISGSIGPSDWLKIKDYHKVIAVNLLGLIDVTHTFMPLIKKTNGRIVNTASVFGRHALQGAAPYTISKYGVEAYSDCLRREMKPFQVSVHIIEPGFHNTNMVCSINDSVRATYNRSSQQVKEEYGEKFVDDAIEAFVKTMVSGLVSEDITPVVDAYTHALTAIFPRARYVVGKDARYLWLMLQALPEFLGDFFIEFLATMNGVKPIPAACKK